MSKKKSQNKKLYDKILNSHPEEDLQKLKVSAGGYSGYTCAAYVSLNGNNQSLDLADLHWNEEELNVGTISVYKLDNDDGTAYPASLTIAGLPSWLSYSLTETTFTVNRYIISGTAPSYESVETVDSSSTSVFVNSPTYTIGTGECTVGGSSSFNVYIDDVNEPHYLTSTDNVLCWDDMFDGQLLNSITINDPDTKTPENRNIAFVQTQGPNAGFISLTGFVPGQAPISFRPVLKNSADLNDTQYTIDIVVSDTKGLLATGTYTLSIRPSVFLEEPSQISTHNVQQFFIPSGLTTSHPVYLGYYTTRDTSLCNTSICNDGSFAKAYFLSRTDGNIYADFSAGLTQDDPGIVSLYTYITNAGTYTGYFDVQGQARPQPSECCSPESIQFITQSYASNIVLDVFKTGIGPDINFSGGIGNVEGSYFLEGLSNNKLAVIPNDTGTTFNSEDNTFFIYNIADTGTLITGVAHSSETGIIEADGLGDHIALRYKSSPSNTFYHYTISTDTFTGISPFSSDIQRIIAVDDSRFWILGQDESVLYNPANFTYTGVNHGIYTGVSGIPSNVAVVSSEDYPAICSSISNENYIFLLDEIHDSGNSHFPLVLDTTSTASGQILPRFSSSYISVANLEDYKVGYYLNYRPDIVQNLNRLVISAEDNFGRSTLLGINYSTNGGTSIIKSMVGSGTHGRISVLRNDTLLWAGAASGAVTQIIDVPNSNVIHNVAVTGSISNVKTNLDQYRTLLLSASGDHGYIVNDYDASVEHFSFTGDLDMGRYGDIAVAEGFVGGDDNFLMLPMTTYESNTISGSLAALSTTTTAQFAVVLSTGVDDYKINETVVSLAESQVTTGEIAIGTFVITDDEFNGGNTFGFPSGIGDNDIFTFDIVGNSGTIKVKAGVALDYETKNTYTGTITGVDPYFVDQPPFADTFVLTVLDVDEPPTQIVLSPASGKIPADQDLSTDYLAAAITITDADSEIEFINNEVVIADGGYKHLFRISDDYTQLFLRENSVLDANTEYDITLLARTSGTSTYTASQNFVLSVGGYRPNGMFMDPITVTIAENTPINSLYHLADLYLTDPDSTDDNEIILTGPDSDYFTVAYTGSTNSGNLYLNANTVLDFETKSSYTGTLIGRMIGTTNTSPQKTFILYVADVLEPSGLAFTPSVVYIDETTGNPSSTILSTLSFTDAQFQGQNMVIFELTYDTGGFRSALDRFGVVDNQTASPDISFLANTALDYESQSIYYILASGYPEGQQSNQLGGLLTVIVNDVDEPPIITFNPTGLTINETTDTNLGNFKLSDITVQDESQSTVTLSLTGTDAEYFTIEEISVTTDSPGSGVILGELHFNSGVSLDFDTKNNYEAKVVATDISGNKTTGIFNLGITDVADCFLSFSSDVYDVVCPENTDGYILVSMNYTGDGASVCTFDRPLSLSWQNLPSYVPTPGGDGSYLYGLGTGTYTATILGGTIPISSVSFDINSSVPMQITQVTMNHIPCENSGSITIAFTGGQPPHYVDYIGTIAEVPSGSALLATIPITNTSSGNIIVRDSNNCIVSGGPYTLTLPVVSNYTFDSQSPPLIHDDVLQSYIFDIQHDIGPYQINIYNSTTGEKGSLVTSIDRYDTSVLVSTTQIGQTIIDENGNEAIVISNDLNLNPINYRYDIGSKIYPGSYILEFVNQNGCVFVTDLQTASNIEPLSANIFTTNDFPLDLGSNVLSQPILDTLFIPYRLIVDDSDVLSYISNITEKSDIRLQVGDIIFDRKALYGSLQCDTYSLLNIKFLGLKSNDWYYTIPFYKGFDISDTAVDILNEDLYLIISDSKKIKIVTELNNNVNTIKLLKGSLLTIDTLTSQFTVDKDIELNQLTNNTFEKLASAKIGSTLTLHNKHIVGNIFMVDFLANDKITENISSSSIESVSFDCKKSQRIIADYRQFLISLNNFNIYDSLYFKTSNNLSHNGFMSLNIAGGSLDINNEYSITYQYYDQETKQMLDIYRNNEILTNQTTLADIKNGSYVVKITDKYGNKLKSVNDVSYDSFFSKMIDYIINELHTTKEALGFKYGDLLMNIYNTFDYGSSTPPPSIPGFEDDPVIEQPDQPAITITTSTHKVSPNTSYTNKLTIQTDPGKVKFVVSGPYGYHKVFSDRVELIQLPPGVYSVEGYSSDLYAKYLKQDRRKIFINTSTNVLVDLHFQLYQDRIIIEDDSN